jgi:hypothetical protein
VVISYLSYQMKRELYYVSSAAARRSDTSAWRRTSKIVDLFRTKSQEKKFVRDLGVYKKTRVTAIKRSKREREKKETMYSICFWYSMTNSLFVVFSNRFRRVVTCDSFGKKKTDFGQSMRLFGNLLTFIIETKKIYEEKKMLIGLVACALIAH